MISGAIATVPRLKGATTMSSSRITDLKARPCCPSSPSATVAGRNTLYIAELSRSTGEKTSFMPIPMNPSADEPRKRPASTLSSARLTVTARLKPERREPTFRERARGCATRGGA